MAAARPFLLGLTGSIGMGKTTTARMIAERGVPVWDADEAVHRLYSPGGAAVAPVAALCPKALVDGAIDRGALRTWVGGAPERIGQLNAVVHPLVAEDREAFIAGASKPILLFDIPLLFETGADAWLDAVAVASTDAETQRQRVMSRPGMSDQQFRFFLAKQTPDAEKRARADFVITTDTLESAARDVDDMLGRIRERLNA